MHLCSLRPTPTHSFLSGSLNSGPGGRRFKSSLPDQFFQALKAHFWISVYSAVVNFGELSTPGGDAYTIYPGRNAGCLRDKMTFSPFLVHSVRATTLAAC